MKRLTTLFIWMAAVSPCGAAPDDTVLDDQEVSNPAAPVVNQRIDENFAEMNVFQRLSPPQRADWKAWARQCVDLEIEGLDREYSLSPEQKEALRFIAEGELVRFDREYRSFNSWIKELNEQGGNPWNNNPDFWTRFHLLGPKPQSRWKGEGTMFSHSTEPLLTPEQLKIYAENEKERDEEYLDMFRAMNIAQFDLVSPMRSDQREKVRAMMAASPGLISPVNRKQGYVWNAVANVLAQASPGRLAEVFEPHQLARVEPALKPMRPQMRLINPLNILRQRLGR